MNFVEAFPKSNGYTVILVIVNRFTKYSHFIPLNHPFRARLIACKEPNQALGSRKPIDWSPELHPKHGQRAA
jgi:hypothetical protein